MTRSRLLRLPAGKGIVCIHRTAALLHAKFCTSSALLLHCLQHSASPQPLLTWPSDVSASTRNTSSGVRSTPTTSASGTLNRKLAAVHPGGSNTEGIDCGAGAG